MNNINKRNYNYDFIRVLSTIMVVLSHSLELVYNSQKTLSTQSNLFWLILHSFCRISVPFFLFLTGALLLNKNFDSKEDIKKFYKHSFLNLVIVCEVWYIIYYLIDITLFGNTFYFKDFIPILFFLKKYPLSHSWYLPMIVGIYLTIPLISIALKKIKSSICVYILLCANIFYLFVIPLIIIIFQILNVDYQIPNTFSIPFGGGIFGTYIIIGYYISQNYNKKKYEKFTKTYVLIIIAILSLVANVYIRTKMPDACWFNMLPILTCSSSVFTLLLKLNIKSLTKKFLVILSSCSFGVYLIHMPILILLYKSNFINASNFILPIKAILYFIISFIISYTIAIIISKIKYLRKYLLYIK